jgi:hypothetical protein
MSWRARAIGVLPHTRKLCRELLSIKEEEKKRFTQKLGEQESYTPTIKVF